MKRRAGTHALNTLSKHDAQAVMWLVPGSRSELSHFRPEMGQSKVCETVRAMKSNTAQATTPVPENGTVLPRKRQVSQDYE